MNIVETTQLGRSYGSRRGISQVSLKIEQGQIFGFLGPNGAGKTTAIRILLGFLKPDEGKATVFGRDCGRESHLIKRQVGYVPGDVRLYPWLTARRALGIVQRIRQQPLMSEGMRLCERFSLEPDLPVRKMSRGNRQKVSLVLALSHRPQVIILDEPTSGLDPLMQVHLMNELQELASTGATIIFSSHTLSEVEQICDHVAMIRGGKIVVDESLNSLKNRAPRTVLVQVRDDVPNNDISWPQSLELVREEGKTVCLRLTGNSMEFLQWASQQPFSDISVGQPSLETLFRSFYDIELKERR
jgi:ABC-2 type transport system ATP-binding protein